MIAVPTDKVKKAYKINGIKFNSNTNLCKDHIRFFIRIRYSTSTNLSFIFLIASYEEIHDDFMCSKLQFFVCYNCFRLQS